MHTSLIAPLCIFFIGGILSAPYQNETRAEEPKKNYRLEASLRPSNYKILLTPYILESEPSGKRFTFDGEVTITLKETKEAARNQIVLHQKHLNILNRRLTTKSEPKKEIVIASVTQDETTDKLTLKLNDPLKKDEEYELYFKYTGKLSDDMKGFYKSYYINPDGKEVWLASTQFQTHHARRAFPCFDEPTFKATFDITISRHKDLKAVSNTEILKPSPESNNRVADTFKTTPPMSTYLVAFLISDFKERSEEKGKFSVLARPGAYEQTEYSFSTGKDVLRAFDTYFGLPYSSLGIEKMDLAAIPDFNAGAMENWGLLTFRERALLYDAKTTTDVNQQSIAATVAHEQAHMWFGDYVTCDWWSYTWLNEGFARYFQYFMLKEVNPSWELEKQFVVDQIHSVFTMDALEDTYPMSDPTVETPEDLGRMFGSISYNKGASVIRMINHALGEEKFKAALKSYLGKNAKKTAVPEALLTELKSGWDNKNVDFEQFLKDFTEQVGYPLVTIKMKEDGNSFTVTQKRFLLKPIEGNAASLLYTIPFTYTTDKKLEFADTKPTVFLSKSDKETTITLTEKSEFIIANLQQTGYYRVNYDEVAWHKIHKLLDSDNFEKIHDINRAQIVDDLFNLGRSKVLNYELVLNILDYLTRETSYIPWTAAFNGYSNIATRLAPENLELFGKQITRVTKKIYEKLGFQESSTDKRLDVYNRAKVLSWACRYGNEDCRNKAKEHFKQLVEKDTPVPVNFRQVVYCTAIREGNDKDFEFLWAKYLNENVATEQVLILNSLGCTKTKDTVEKYLKHILSSKVRRQDKSAALSSLYSENHENIQVVFDYVTKNYKDFIEPFGGLSEVTTILTNIASKFTTAAQVKALTDFYEKNKEEFKESGSKIEKSIKSAEDNLKWTTDLMPHFMDILKTKNSGTILKSFNILVSITLAVLTITWFH